MRAIVVASANLLAGAVQAWLSLIIWQQVDAPRYRKGFITLPFISAACIATAIIIRALYEKKGTQRQ
jgi:ACS family pantothenate transporter-like MFS transporter